MGKLVAMADVVTAPTYSVGYGRPPVHSRFQPGASGNPRGRPRGAKNKRTGISLEIYDDIVLEEAHRQVTVQEKGRPRKISITRAVTRVINTNALKGHARAQKLHVETIRAAEARKRAERERYVELAATYKADALLQIATYKAQGRPTPLLIPHPDDMDFSFETGSVEITGPKTRAEYDAWTELARERDSLRRTIAFSESEQVNERRKKRREALERVADKLREAEASIVEVIGEWPKHWCNYQPATDQPEEVDDEDGDDDSSVPVSFAPVKRNAGRLAQQRHQKHAAQERSMEIRFGEPRLIRSEGGAERPRKPDDECGRATFGQVTCREKMAARRKVAQTCPALAGEAARG